MPPLPFEHGPVRLRPFRRDDLDSCLELETDEDVMKTTGIGRALEPIVVEERLERQLGRPANPLGAFAVEQTVDGSFVAWAMLVETRFEQPELGFMLPKRLWGQGLATHTARAVAHYAFDALHYPRVYATTSLSNAASRRVLEKIGMQFKERITIGAAGTKSEMELNVFVLDATGSPLSPPTP